MKYATIIAAGLLAVATVAWAAEPPKPNPVPSAWELNFEFQAPQPITVKLPGDNQAKTYWYMFYTVTNKAGKDQYFAPRFTLYTETGQLLQSGQGVPAGVFAAIQKRHNNVLLLDPTSIIGKILQGDDNAKDGVAIFADIDSKARNFDIFVTGLSGESVQVTLPEPVTTTITNDQGTAEQISVDKATLFKTLRLAYDLPGEASARARTAPKLVKQEWVMR